MSDSKPDAGPVADASGQQIPVQQPTLADPAGKKKRANMHEGIAVWCDCCSCEAEPRWLEVAAELGMTFNDYEDEGAETP